MAFWHIFLTPFTRFFGEEGFEFLEVAIFLGGDSEEREACFLEGGVYEFAALCTVLSGVAFIVEFAEQDGNEVAGPVALDAERR